MRIVIVTKILHPKTAGVETWLTSDGRAYLVQLYDVDNTARPSYDTSRNVDSLRVCHLIRGHGLAHAYPAQSRSALSVNNANSNANTHMQHWQGTCIHDVEPPRWVQKRRMVRPDEPQYDYDEPQTATAVAINTKFSVYAVGLQS